MGSDLLRMTGGPTPFPEATAPDDVLPRDDAARLRRMATEHLALVWRVLRRLGASPDVADDGAQEVFVVAARRIADIEPGSERAFLVGTARRVARALRRPTRAVALEAEIDASTHATNADALCAEDPSPEELSDHKRARERLDAILESMDDDPREVFVLHEIEGLSLPEIAAIAQVPLGTATSRLRRAREIFEQKCKRFEERGLGKRGVRT